MKAAARDVLAFYLSDWDALAPTGTKGDDWALSDGLDDAALGELPPTQKVDVRDLGALYYQGENAGWKERQRTEERMPTTLSFFKKWRRLQTHQTITLHVPVAQVGALLAYAKTLGASEVKGDS